MSILKYFHPVKKSCRDQLPDPHGPLNIDGKVPSSAIASANIAVQAVLAGASDKSDATTDSSSGSNSRGPYLHLTPAQKFNIGKRASEHGVTSTLRYYKKAFPDLPLKETSVRRFKNLFQQSLRRPRSDSSKDLGELPNKTEFPRKMCPQTHFLRTDFLRHSHSLYGFFVNCWLLLIRQTFFRQTDICDYFAKLFSHQTFVLYGT